MLELKKIAITGGISSGKSQVCDYFSELGAYVVDADEIVHQLLTPNTDLGKKVVELLGSGIVIGGNIDRTRVARKVFLNPRLLRSLEALLHPRVYEEIENHYQKVKNLGSYPLFIAEIPLLFETDGDKFFEFTIAVIADREACWNRYRRTTGHEREDFNRRCARQLKQLDKALKADYTITNNGTLQQLQNEVILLFDRLCEKGSAKHQKN